MPRWLVPGLAALLLVSCSASTGASQAERPATPIRYVVVIFDENASFDHYFGIYPYAANLPSETPFTPLRNTPRVNGLTPQLLQANPNRTNPQRLKPAQASTCDPVHSYTALQQASDGGRMDQFMTSTNAENCGDVTVMDYFDGNTVTALWNYAQRFAMSDNAFEPAYGESSPGALNLIAGQTHGASSSRPSPVTKNGTLASDGDPMYDDCGAGLVAMSGMNVGDLLEQKGISWGWFQAGFRPTGTSADGKALCQAKRSNVAGREMPDYVPHHEPFQYYASTANPHHLPPSSVSMIGKLDQANHQYDLQDFWAAAQAGNVPAVSFLKAAATEDGHPYNSSPLDEQRFLVDTINRLQALPQWPSMAVFLTYDDSGGWYDHVPPPLVSPSNDADLDVECGTPPAGAYLDRCGDGPRVPLLIISPYAKPNFVDHTQVTTASILRFIEDNWSLGRLGNQSFDESAGSLLNMLDFQAKPRTSPLILTPDHGTPASGAQPARSSGSAAGGPQFSSSP